MLLGEPRNPRVRMVDDETVAIEPALIGRWS